MKTTFDFKKAVQPAVDFWHSLPHQLQATIIVFASAAGPVIWKWWSDPQACMQWACLKHTITAAINAGGVALAAFYMRPGRGRSGGPGWEATDPVLTPEEIEAARRRLAELAPQSGS
jgi:hypothetical protein